MFFPLSGRSVLIEDFTDNYTLLFLGIWIRIRAENYPALS